MRYLDAVDTGPKRWSRIGLGTWQFGSREWGYGDAYANKQAARIVERALELGVTFFDTAEIYGFGRSEHILGAALGERAADVVVASKILPVLPTAAVVHSRGLRSAERLGVTTLDLYQVHAPNPVVPDGTTMRGMALLQRRQAVVHVGVSNYPATRWRHAEAALGSPVLSDQVQYSLVHREPETDQLAWARQAGRIVIAYSPLAQGFLSARHTATDRPTTGVRAMNPLFLPENLTRAQPLFGVLREVAAAHDATPAQVALAWAIHDPHVVAIPGASSVEQLEHNVAAADLELSTDEYDALTRASDDYHPVTGPAAVSRLGRGLLQRLGRH